MALSEAANQESREAQINGRYVRQAGVFFRPSRIGGNPGLRQLHVANLMHNLLIHLYMTASLRTASAICRADCSTSCGLLLQPSPATAVPCRTDATEHGPCRSKPVRHRTPLLYRFVTETVHPLAHPHIDQHLRDTYANRRPPLSRLCPFTRNACSTCSAEMMPSPVVCLSRQMIWPGIFPAQLPALSAATTPSRSGRPPWRA